MAAATLANQGDVFSLPKPRQGEAVYFDEGKDKVRVNGLALRIRESGSRSFVFFYRFAGRLKKYKIGDASTWTLDDARKEARKLRVEYLDRQMDPSAAKAMRVADARAVSSLLFRTMKQDYINVRGADMKPRSHQECVRHLELHWKPFDSLALPDVTQAAVAAQLRTIAQKRGIVAANRARSTLSAMYAWAIGEGHATLNPVMGTNKQKGEKPRERVLSDAELAAIWRACPDNEYGRIVRLLMLTAQRREEIGSLRHSEIVSPDDSTKALIALPGSRTKNGRPHDVPLSRAALGALACHPLQDNRDLVFGEREGGFSGWSKAKGALDNACGVKDWTLHDLRRTAATRMADLGVQPYVIEAVLNHVSGHKAGVAGIYNRSTYAAEKRAALDLWANHLMIAIAQSKGGNVTKLRRAK